jgi:hypothetical protein
VYTLTSPFCCAVNDGRFAHEPIDVIVDDDMLIDDTPEDDSFCNIPFTKICLFDPFMTPATWCQVFSVRLPVVAAILLTASDAGPALNVKVSVRPEFGSTSSAHNINSASAESWALATIHPSLPSAGILTHPQTVN